ncbi:MAG: leucyl aminopeptidase [Alphaproteobacteria bacterium]|nr:leucyl aminopeptidase [Alphaproteobacteria bacterium]
MDIRFSTDAPTSVSADALAVFAGTDWRGELAELDAALGGRLIGWLESQGFEGNGNATHVTATFGAIGAPLLVVVGVGERTVSDLRNASARAAREARSSKVRHLALHSGLGSEGVRTVYEHVVAGNYEYDTYKAETERRPALDTLTLVGVEDGPDAARIAKKCAVRTKWQSWARDLVNAPPADLYPETLAAAVVKDIGSLPGVTVEVWDFERCEKEGMVGIVAVGQGSSRPGCYIHITYHPKNAKEHIAFVGKGVTFDSGGLSLKPSLAMQTMRMDMGGAATVLGATAALAELGAPIAVDCFVGAVENMAGANSYKLGDILKYRNGVTVEIHNTDAEGRLVLADCLINASATEGVTQIIDAATLTGACVIAIGTDFTGMFTNDEGMAHDLSLAASADGEGLWRLPLHAPYKEKLRGDWSKLKNVGGRDAGATTAALFLQHFVTDDKRWTHLDIAGSAWREKGNGTWAAGATGEMVRTLTTWAERLEGQKR